MPHVAGHLAGTPVASASLPIGGLAGSAGIQQAFQDILGRQADPGGLAFFQGDLASGQSIEDIRRSISASPEAQAFAQSQIAPPTGLIGREQALMGGQQQAVQALQAAQTGGQQAIQQGTAAFDPFLQQGQQAAGIQAALAGASGLQAQQAALANLQPVNQFLQERGEQALLRNQAAIGGLGGGRVRQALTEFGQGLAGQSAQQQFQNLGTVAGQGLTAAAGTGGLQQTQANLLAGIGGQQAGVFTGVGGQLATGRTAAGQDIAQAIGGTTSALANLAQQQGAGISDILGVSGGNLANLLAGAGTAGATSQQTQAQILANLAAQQGTSTAALPGIGGLIAPSNQLGQTGQLLGGFGTLLQSLPQTTA